MPQNDAEVAPIGRYRGILGARVLLPSDEAIECCQDKFLLYEHLTRFGLRMAETYAVGSVNEIEAIVDRLGAPERMWCRMRRGSGSRGSLPVKSAAQAGFWIRYLEETRGVAPGAFLLSEYPAWTRLRFPKPLVRGRARPREDVRTAVVPHGRSNAERHFIDAPGGQVGTRGGGQRGMRRRRAGR